VSFHAGAPSGAASCRPVPDGANRDRIDLGPALLLVRQAKATLGPDRYVEWAYLEQVEDMLAKVRKSLTGGEG